MDCHGTNDHSIGAPSRRRNPIGDDTSCDDDVDGVPEAPGEPASDRKSEVPNDKSNRELSEDEDEFEDDWFLKLSSGKNGVARGLPPANRKESSEFFAANRIQVPREENLDLKEKTVKSLRIGLRKIWKRGSATITVEDPTYKVAYLGNILTGWAKGEGCIEKPVSSLWKNYTESSKPEVQMKITVTQSGLKAVTKEHGLIEYWSNRITYCTVGPGLPKVFCWIYRHEGRKLKQELRCHAVLCSKDWIAARMATTLESRLTQALMEFKRSKLIRQNARLSLANSICEHPSLPRRKILLSSACHNYKPPLERSKSAPKLMSIEESLEEEEEEQQEQDEEEEEEKKKMARKSSGDEEEMDGTRFVRERRNRPRKTNVENKCEYKLANLSFVKKLCSSIENLVESTSNYGRKFFAERKTSKDFLYLSTKKSDPFSSKKKADDECVKVGKILMSIDVGPESGPETGGHRKPENDDKTGGGSRSLRVAYGFCTDVSAPAISAAEKNDDSPSDSRGRGGRKNGETLRAYLRDCNEAFVRKVGLRQAERALGETEEPAADDHDRLDSDGKEIDVSHREMIKSTVLGRT